MSIETLATVKSWDAAAGTGVLARGDGSEDVEVSRALLVAATDLVAGQRVAFHHDYEPDPDGEWGWIVHDVRVVSADDAASIELEQLCRDVAYAESRMNTASEVASDDDVESSRDDLVRADQRMRSRVPEIGAGLYARGGEDAMRAVLGQVDPKYRATITIHWRGIGAWEG
jgi:cold shock CspA family protein